MPQSPVSTVAKLYILLQPLLLSRKIVLVRLRSLAIEETTTTYEYLSILTDQSPPTIQGVRSRPSLDGVQPSPFSKVYLRDNFLERFSYGIHGSTIHQILDIGGSACYTRRPHSDPVTCQAAGVSLKDKA